MTLVDMHLNGMEHLPREAVLFDCWPVISADNGSYEVDFPTPFKFHPLDADAIDEFVVGLQHPETTSRKSDVPWNRCAGHHERTHSASEERYRNFRNSGSASAASRTFDRVRACSAGECRGTAHPVATGKR